MASVAGVRALPLYGVYCATKAGIVMLTKVMATELSRDGIHVNSISPGNTETPMNETIRTDPEWKPILDFMQKVTPSGRTYSTADEIAKYFMEHYYEQFVQHAKTLQERYGLSERLD